MTDQEITIAVAGAVGTLKWSYALPEKTLHCDVPDYANDIDAMHRAFEWLRLNRDEYTFTYELNQNMRIAVEGVPLWHASARERAEAFLRTIGKWVE